MGHTFVALKCGDIFTALFFLGTLAAAATTCMPFCFAPLPYVRSKQQSATRISGIHGPRGLAKQTLLSANIRNSTDMPARKKQLVKGQNLLDSYLTDLEPRLLAVDIVSISVAAQLMGLIDVLNEPTFWIAGGWMQPISADQSALPTMIQRDSILSISWVLSALGWKGYSQINTTKEEILSTIATIAVGFVAVRVALGYAISYLGHVEFDGVDMLRQCYITVLMVGLFRFLYSQYSR